MRVRDVFELISSPTLYGAAHYSESSGPGDKAFSIKTLNPMGDWILDEQSFTEAIGEGDRNLSEFPRDKVPQKYKFIPGDIFMGRMTQSCNWAIVDKVPPAAADIFMPANSFLLRPITGATEWIDPSIFMFATYLDSGRRWHNQPSYRRDRMSAKLIMDHEFAEPKVDEQEAVSKIMRKCTELRRQRRKLLELEDELFMSVACHHARGESIKGKGLRSSLTPK